ncbi:MAG: glycosyltransferase family 10 [Deltaproteobacteria bacterium]
MGRDLVICIYQKYDYPALLRQTPGAKGLWNGVRFKINSFNEPCDMLVVLNKFYEEVSCECAQAWLVVQEPPIAEQFPWVFDGHRDFSKVFSPIRPFRGGGKKYILSHGALPWHVDKTYDELKALRPPEKDRSLSWITTDKKIFPGHRERMGFLKAIKGAGIEFDLFGRGFAPIEDKWDGLAAYRYSLAIENHSGPHYWTEKIADCFLSWTMPIYYGCTNLDDYFPKESFVRIDILSPHAIEQIKDVVESGEYMKNRDAIAYARELVLDRYQLFPFIAEAALCHGAAGSPGGKLRNFRPYGPGIEAKVRKYIRRFYAF